MVKAEDEEVSARSVSLYEAYKIRERYVGRGQGGSAELVCLIAVARRRTTKLCKKCCLLGGVF